MPGISGIDAIPSVLQAVPEARILVLSMQDDPRYVRQALSEPPSFCMMCARCVSAVRTEMKSIAANS